MGYVVEGDGELGGERGEGRWDPGPVWARERSLVEAGAAVGRGVVILDGRWCEGGPIETDGEEVVGSAEVDDRVDGFVLVEEGADERDGAARVAGALDDVGRESGVDDDEPGVPQAPLGMFA